MTANDTPALFEAFKWAVDEQGYDLVQKEEEEIASGVHRIAGIYVERRGGELRWYRPLKERTLFREFASISNDQGLLDFACRYGLLSAADGSEELWADWTSNIAALKRVIVAIDEGRGNAVAQLFNEGIAPVNLGISHDKPEMMLPFTIERARQPTARIRIQARKGARATLQLEPPSLLQAIWLQVAGQITSGTEYKKCKQCPEWWPVGKGAYTSRREFCSDKCRVAWNRKQNKEKANAR